ncbi:MAG: neutral/alkaline non-lysosomal ceramidase N-terminal domain-containing protein [Bacteroidales bacterium]|nr:neutral/alkaline non-lysosomal ceramidase N-terminal domain-containing protein [Bacteroidales bacterium]
MKKPDIFKSVRSLPASTAKFLLAAGVSVALLVIVSGCTTTEQPKIKVGLGETIITPPIGTPMRGYSRSDVSKGVHDELYARALVIEGADSTSIALITIAVCNMDVKYMDAIREGVNKQTGIPVDNIVISSTHTHSGPYIEKSDSDYQKLFVGRSIQSAVDAWNKRIPGRIGFGSTTVPELAKNDRRMEYGGLTPDPEAAIIKVEDAKGKLLGVVFNYGCHPSTLDKHNFLFTEDWPYYSIKGIREALGEDVWVAYYQSAQGDVKVGYTAELSAIGADMHGIRTFEYAEYKGNMMVDAVLNTLPSIQTSGNPVIRTANGYYDYPLRDSYPISAREAQKQLDEAKAKLAEMEKKADTIGKRVLDRYKVAVFLADLTANCARWVEDHPNPEPLKNVRHQAIRIGDAIFVTVPCEVFTEIGLKIKQQSPFEKTFVLGLAAGCPGYIPTAEEFLEGGYAVVNTHYSPKCENVTINACLEQINKMKGDR